MLRTLRIRIPILVLRPAMGMSRRVRGPRRSLAGSTLRMLVPVRVCTEAGRVLGRRCLRLDRVVLV